MTHRNRKRAAALGVLLGVIAGVTAAAFVDVDRSTVRFTPRTFDLQVAGTAVTRPELASWTPAASDWTTGTGITLDFAGAEHTMQTGSSLDARLAVRNTAEVPASVTVRATAPRGTESALFDRLDVTVRDGDTPLAAGPARQVRGSFTLPAGGSRVLDVTVSLDRGPAGASTPTGFRIVLEGETR